MGTVALNRGEVVALGFTITDSANGLGGKRVTWSVAFRAGAARLLRKVGGLPGSTADITITTQTAGQIIGKINISAADFDILCQPTYAASLWIDDGAGNDRCVTPGGVDTLSIINDVARAA